MSVSQQGTTPGLYYSAAHNVHVDVESQPGSATASQGERRPAKVSDDLSSSRLIWAAPLPQWVRFDSDRLQSRRLHGCCRAGVERIQR